MSSSLLVLSTMTTHLEIPLKLITFMTLVGELTLKLYNCMPKSVLSVIPS